MKKRLFSFLLFINIVLINSLLAENWKADSLLRIAETSKDTTLVSTLLQISKHYGYSHFDSAIKYIVIAEDKAVQLDYNQGFAEALFLHGNTLYFNNYYTDAKQRFKQCLEIAEKLNNNLLKACCFERLASIHLYTDNPTIALEYYYKSLTIFEKLNDLRGIAKVYNILGIYKAECEEFELAESYLLKSLAINQQFNDTHNIVENKGNLGYVYELSDRFDKAEAIYLELITELTEMNEKYNLPVIYFNLGFLLQNKGESDSAITIMKKAIHISEQTNDTALLSSLYGNTGELLLDDGKTESAKVFLEKSVLCSDAIGDPETECQALGHLVKIDSMSSDLESQLIKTKRILQLKETIYAKRINSSLKASELQYENQQKESTIELQEQTIESNKVKKQLHIILLLISSIAILLLLVVVLIVKKSQRKSRRIHNQQIALKQLEVEKARREEQFHKLQKENAEEALMCKGRELTYGALQLEQKHTLLKYFSDSIREIIAKDNNNPYNAELEILEASFKTKLKDQADQDLFNRQFNQVHQEFFNQLKSKHPNLTKTELKFCAYLRIQLSTTQISSFLNVTIDAIRKTRYRIRKKLNLKPEDSLEDYIMKF